MDTKTSSIPASESLVTADHIVEAAQGIVDGVTKVLEDPYAFGARIGRKAAQRTLGTAVLGERPGALTLDAIVRRASAHLASVRPPMDAE